MTTTTYRLMRVNPETWEDDGVIAKLDSLSVRRDCSGDAPLLEQATMTFSYDITADFTECWARVEQYEDSGRSRSLTSIGTYLLMSDTGSTDHRLLDLSVDGYSVLKPCSDQKFMDTRFIAKGQGGAEFVKGLIQECSPAPVRILGDDFKINDYFVFAADTPYLTAIWQVLDLGGWCMRIDGRGAITIMAIPTTPSLVLDRKNMKLLMPGMSYDRKRSDIPNRYKAVGPFETVVVENRQAGSHVSYRARGNRWVDYYDSSPMPSNGENLQKYAERQLEALSTVTLKYTYTREYVDGILPFDIVQMRLTDLGVEGDMRVLSQSLNFGHGITVEEVAGKEEKEYIAP